MLHSTNPVLTCVRVVCRDQLWLPRIVNQIEANLDKTANWTLSKAARRGFVHLMQRLAATETVSHHYRIELFSEAMRTAARHGFVFVMEWLSSNYLPNGVVRGALCEAVMGNHLAASQWLNNQYPFDKCDSDTIAAAAGCGQLAILQWLMVNRSEDWKVATNDTAIDLMACATAGGHLEVVQWMHESGIRITTTAMDAAAAGGHLMVVAWLATNTSEGCTTNAMDGAAANGHLAMVEWLHFNRPEGCTSRAMDEAAGNNHLDVVQWLHSHRHEGCSVAAMDLAAASGHLDMLAWIHQHMQNGCSARALEGAAAQGRLDVLQWLHDRCLPDGTLSTTGAMDLAAANGFLDVVEWLHLNRPEGCSTKAMDLAATNGHLHVVQWLHSHRREGCTTAAMDGAASNGHLHVIEWLHTHRGEGCTASSMDNAAKQGMLDIVTFLRKNRHEVVSTQSAMEHAAVHGQFAIWVSLFDPMHATSARSHINLSARSAAKTGQLRQLEWLYENYPDSIDLEAVRFLGENYGHMHVVSWLDEVHAAKSHNQLRSLQPLSQSDAPLGPLIAKRGKRKILFEDDNRWGRLSFEKRRVP